jgi:flagellar P-ring protein precursor FlgI
MLRLVLALILALSAAEALAAARIKDITSIRGVRENQLIGYGLVIGLAGSGDTLRNAPFTEQSLQSMLNHLGVNVSDANLRTRNVAAVMVTAELPPFIGRGSRIDVTVSSLGDAKSLLGGTLLMTQLQGADRQVYAVAQGALSVSGFEASGEAGSVEQGVPTTGRIPNGALVEQVVPGYFDTAEPIVLELRNPDFATALEIARAINAFTSRRYGVQAAREDNSRQLTLYKPADISAARFVAEIGELRVTPDTPAKVVIDERTGTVVIGTNVQISPVAVTHGTLTVRITETPIVSQPNAFGEGDTVVVPRTDVEVNEGEGSLAIVGGTDLQALVHGLNQIGLKPTGIMAILQAIKSAGALQADLVLQ